MLLKRYALRLWWSRALGPIRHRLPVSKKRYQQTARQAVDYLRKIEHERQQRGRIEAENRELRKAIEGLAKARVEHRPREDTGCHELFVRIYVDPERFRELMISGVMRETWARTIGDSVGHQVSTQLMSLDFATVYRRGPLLRRSYFEDVDGPRSTGRA